MWDRKKPGEKGAPPEAKVSPPVETHGDAMAKIAETGGPRALKVVGDIMEQSHEEQIRQLNSLLDVERQTVVDLQRELRQLRRVHETIQRRLLWVLGEVALDVDEDLGIDLEDIYQRLDKEA